MQTCEEFRVEWESVVFLGMNQKMWERREERKRRGQRGGGGGCDCGVVVCVHSPHSFCSSIPADMAEEELAASRSEGQLQQHTQQTHKHSFTMQGSFIMRSLAL